MKIDTARQFLGFHILADVEVWWSWNRFYCPEIKCEAKFNSKRKLKNHINYECEYVGKLFQFGASK
jgi:hypothetical protein